MIGSLLILGFTLSLDNFRTAIALGGLRPTGPAPCRSPFVFGFCDAVAPLVGILIGHYWSESIGSTGRVRRGDRAGRLRPVSVIRAWRTAATDEFDRPWAVFGLLVPLSAGQRRRRHEPGPARVLAVARAPVFGLITFVMALVGLQVGRAAAHVIRIRPDLLTGVALVIMAGVLGPRA